MLIFGIMLGLSLLTNRQMFSAYSKTHLSTVFLERCRYCARNLDAAPPPTYSSNVFTIFSSEWCFHRKPSFLQKVLPQFLHRYICILLRCLVRLNPFFTIFFALQYIQRSVIGVAKNTMTGLYLKSIVFRTRAICVQQKEANLQEGEEQGSKSQIKLFILFQYARSLLC